MNALRASAVSVTTVLATVLATTACSRNEPASPGGTTPATTSGGSAAKAEGPAVAPEQPARIVSGSGSQPTVAGQPAAAAQGQMPPGHPPIGAAASGDAADPHGGLGAAAAGGGGPSGTIKGTITLDAARAADVKAGTVLYIIVRRDAGEGQKGMLIASRKVEVTGPAMFPLTYEIGPENVMMAGSTLDGQVRVEARVDQDGDAISKSPGDVVGAKAGAVTMAPSVVVDFALTDKL